MVNALIIRTRPNMDHIDGIVHDLFNQFGKNVDCDIATSEKEAAQFKGNKYDLILSDRINFKFKAFSEIREGSPGAVIIGLMGYNSISSVKALGTDVHYYVNPLNTQSANDLRNVYLQSNLRNLN